MKAPSKKGLFVAALLTIAWVFMSGSRIPDSGCACGSSLFFPTANASEVPSVEISTPTTVPLPRLVDLGASRCIPCKMMAPILEGLKKEYAGRMDVDFIDVWKNPDAGKKYAVEIIPTQIFFNAEGKELYRHEGFYSKEDILKKWKELGINIAEKKEKK